MLKKNKDKSETPEGRKARRPSFSPFKPRDKQPNFILSVLCHTVCILLVVVLVFGVGGFGALEVYDAHFGVGPLIAEQMTARAIELAKAVVEACEEPVNIKFLYDLEMPLRQRVELIAKEVYGADGVDWAPLAVQKAERFESDPKYKDYCTMMVKTHLSLSDDPTKKGVPTGWRLAIRDILEYGGAKFLCPMAGTISMMPGTAANPAYRRIDVDTETGKVSGLF